MSINDIVSKLTPEEKEQHKEIIQECIERENNINKNTKISYETLKRLDQSNKEFAESLSNLDKISQETLDVTRTAQLQLTLLPYNTYIQKK